MIYIEIDHNNRVTYVRYDGKNFGKGIMIDSIPKLEQREGYYPIMYYRNEQIVYEYEKIPDAPIEEEIPIPTISYERQVQNKIHEIYSLDDEIAIVRKEIARLGNNSEEFSKYNTYAENCKKQIKEGLQ